MTRTQIQFPDPLYQRLKEIAEQRDWSLSEVMRKAAEHFVTCFPGNPKPRAVWRFPTLDCGGDFLTDPASLRPEADAFIDARLAFTLRHHGVSHFDELEFDETAPVLTARREVNRAEWERTLEAWQASAESALKGHPWEKQSAADIINDLRGGPAETPAIAR